MSSITVKNNYGRGQASTLALDVTCDADVDAAIVVTVSDPDTGGDIADVFIDTVDDADQFLADVTAAVERFKAAVAAAGPDDGGSTPMKTARS